MEKRRRSVPGLEAITRTVAYRITVLAITLLTLAPSLARPATPPRLVSNDALSRALIDAFEDAELGRNAKLSIYVADVDRGMTWVNISGDDAFVPASLLKLVTSAAALETLGPDRRFETTLETDGEITDGVLFGNLIVRGGGDMTLGPRFQEDKDDVNKLFADWIELLSEKGISRITGHVIGDDRRYPNDSHALGWDRMEYGEWYSAEVGPLCFNDNCIDIVWKASSKAGGLARARKIPDTEYVTLVSGVRVGPERMDTPWLRYFRFRESNEIRARGLIPPKSQKYDYAAVHDPASFVAFVLREQLQRKKIQVTGTSGPGRIMFADDMEGNSSGTLVLDTIESPPLAEILPVVNTISQNLYAEVLLRETALERGYPATFSGGADAVRDWLFKKDLYRPGFVQVDGSGLSPINRMPARLAVNLLRYMRKGPQGRLWHDSLASPGEGSLRNRFEEKKYDPLRGKLHAKTGFLTGTIALGGYFEHLRGEEYAFAIMINDFSSDRTRAARDLVEDLALILQQSNVLP